MSKPNISAQNPAQHLEDYQRAFTAGRKRAASWFAQHGYSMAVYRDLKRAEYAQGQIKASANGAVSCDAFPGFDAGFAAGVSELIAGAQHV